MFAKSDLKYRLLSIISVICIFGQIAEAGDIIYVKEGATGDGSSWASAYGDLQDMHREILKTFV